MRIPRIPSRRVSAVLNGIVEELRYQPRQYSLISYSAQALGIDGESERKRTI